MSASTAGSDPSAAGARWLRDLRRGVRAVGRVRPRRSVGAVEAPDETAPTTVTVLGWAYLPRDRVAAVVVTVEGRVLALARLGLAAPDVGEVRGSSEAAWSGWAAEVDLSQYASRRVEIGAVATTASGLAEPLTARQVDVREVEPEDRTSIAVLESVVPDVLFVSGTTATSVLPSRIEIVVDGRPLGRARLLAGPTREHASRRCVQALVAGFTHVVERPDASPGRISQVEARVTMVDGTERRIGPIAVRVPDVASEPEDLAALRARALQRAAEPGRPRVPTLRVLAITHSLTLGGGQLYLSELLQELIQAPDVSCVVVAPRDGPLRARLEAWGAIVHITGEYPVDSAAAYESQLAELAGLARYYDSNVAVINTLGASIGADLAGILDIPSVWAVHESFEPPLFWAEAFGPDGYDPHVRDRGLHAIGHVNAMVFEADATRDLFEPYADPKRLVTLPYGIGLDEIDDFRREHPAGHTREGHADHVDLLVVGTFEPRKAQARIAIAFSRLADEFPAARLFMVGAGHDPYTRGVRDIVQRLHLGDRIRIVAVTGDLYAWYARADGLISASDIESLPRSVLEAMAFDVPVVATSVFGLPEVITDGVDGLLMEPRDLSALESGLRRFLALDAAARAGLGRAGGERVRARYGSSDYVEQWSTLLRGLVEDPRAVPSSILGSRTVGEPVPDRS